MSEPFTVGRLYEMVAELDRRGVPDSYELTKNAIGNLAIFAVNGEYLGYLDFTTGRLEYWGDE